MAAGRGFYGLVMDGVAFTRSGGRIRGQRASGAALLKDGDGDANQKRRASSHASLGSAKSSKSAKSSSSKSSSKKSNKSRSKERRKSGDSAKIKGAVGKVPSEVTAPAPDQEVNLGRQQTDMTDAFGNLLRR